MTSRWKPENAASIAWIGLFLPGLCCYLHFLLQHLNQYPEVAGSSIKRLVPEQLDDIIPRGATVEVVADGFGFTEGTQWVHDTEADRQYLLFSDVANNRIWKWEEGGGLFTLGKSLFLDRSGCRGDHCSTMEMSGSNGLMLVPRSGEVVMCEHGDRRVTRMENNGTKTPLATHFNGHRLNSPNDLALSKRGDIYFTDPPYGLPLRQKDPGFAAHGFGGVYRVRREVIEAAKAGEAGAREAAGAEPELMEKEFTWPNGLAFSPDFSKLYLAVSSPDRPAWHVYDVEEDGELANRRLFLDARPMKEAYGVGVPDGMKVDERGNVFAAAPGGVAVVSPGGQHLGMVLTGGVFVANVALADDGYLYMAASERVLRVKVLTKAAPAPPSID
ncbi:unnamed protein product [Ectocarpus sp. 6 AP-2014]